MQATVSSFDPATRAGAVLLDDGVEIPFAAGALAESGLRFLRPGQRVRLETSGSDESFAITRLQILTLA